MARGAPAPGTGGRASNETGCAAAGGVINPTVSAAVIDRIPRISHNIERSLPRVRVRGRGRVCKRRAIVTDMRPRTTALALIRQALCRGLSHPPRRSQQSGARVQGGRWHAALHFPRASGARIEDADGNSYIDYVMSWGPLIHGHAPKGLLKALAAAAARGTSFGAPTDLETRLAQRVAMLMPSMERVRFVSSGTEAAMSAIRVARAATKRDKILKFEGCYHGHADAFLVQAGSGAMTLGVPTSPGVPAAVAAERARALQRPDVGGRGRRTPPPSDRRDHRGTDRREHRRRAAGDGS